MAGIQAISVFFPEAPKEIEKLDELQFLEDEQKEIFLNLGIQSVVDAKGHSSIALAVEASKRALKAAELLPEQIDIIIFLQSRIPDYLMSSEALRVQHEIGAEHAFSFTITDLGCVGISSALLLAKNILDADPSKNNILITYGSKPFSKKRFRYPVTIIGDGGMGVVVSRTEKNKILDLRLETNGKYWDLYSIDYKTKPPEEWSEVCKNLNVYSVELSLESRNRLQKMNRDILESLGMGYDGVNHFIMQNLAFGAFGFYENLFEIEFYEGCKDNLERYGHLGSMDIMLNLAHGLESEVFKPNEKVLVMNNSPVAAWSSMLIQI